MVTFLVVIGLLVLSAIWFFIGVLFAKRNPKYADKMNASYVKGKMDAEEELKEKLRQAEQLVRNKTGGIEIPIVGNLKKYLLRFALPLAVLLGAIAVLKPESLGVVLYKVCLILVGLVLCELVWLISYKPIFGKTERLELYEMRSVLIFRGVLYLAIILGITWGL